MMRDFSSVNYVMLFVVLQFNTQLVCCHSDQYGENDILITSSPINSVSSDGSPNYVFTHKKSIILACSDALKGYLQFCSFLHSVLLLQIRLDAATKLHSFEQHGPCVGLQQRLIYISFCTNNYTSNAIFSKKNNDFF